jgi:hypothetical protein
MQRRAIRTCWRFGTRTCSVGNDASHNHKDNNGGHHAASTPFPMPRVIRVSHCPIVGVSVCHSEPPDIPSLKNERRLSTAVSATASEMVLRRKRRRRRNAPVDFSELEATAPPHSRDTRLQLRLKAGHGS